MTTKREPSEKQIFKTKAKAFIESLSRKCFGRHYKSLTVTRHQRRGEVKYKLVAYNQSFNDLQKFHIELAHRFTEFKVSYTGTLNSKTYREEWFIEIIVFGDLITKAGYEPTLTKKHSIFYSETNGSERAAF